jgi:hypothetical protein
LPPSVAVLIVPAGPMGPPLGTPTAVHVPQVVDHVLMLSASADVLSIVRTAIEIALIMACLAVVQAMPGGQLSQAQLANHQTHNCVADCLNWGESERGYGFPITDVYGAQNGQQ